MCLYAPLVLRVHIADGEVLGLMDIDAALVEALIRQLPGAGSALRQGS